jgi:hypothetical protein
LPCGLCRGSCFGAVVRHGCRQLCRGAPRERWGRGPQLHRAPLPVLVLPERGCACCGGAGYLRPPPPGRRVSRPLLGLRRRGVLRVQLGFRPSSRVLPRCELTTSRVRGCSSVARYPGTRSILCAPARRVGARARGLCASTLGWRSGDGACFLRGRRGDHGYAYWGAVSMDAWWSHGLISWVCSSVRCRIARCCSRSGIPSPSAYAIGARSMGGCRRTVTAAAGGGGGVFARLIGRRSGAGELTSVRLWGGG